MRHRKGTPRKVLRLRQLRRASEMSQDTLARRVGLNKSTICMIENGDRQPSFQKAVDIAAVFGESVEEVFRLVEVPA